MHVNQLFESTEALGPHGQLLWFIVFRLVIVTISN